MMIFNNYCINKRQKKLIIGLLLAIVLYSIHPLYSITALLISLQQTRSYVQFEPCGIILMISLLLYAYVGYSTRHVTATNILWCVLPAALSFLLGRKIGRDYYSYDLLLIVFVVFLGLALPHIVLTLIDIVENGLVNPERTLSIFGGNEQQRAVTGRTMELSLAIGGFSMLFVKNGSILQKKICWLFVILAVLAEICTLHYLSRTGIVLLIISVFVGVIYQKGNSRQTLLFCFLFIIGCYLLSDSQLFNLFRERELEGSNLADAGGRTERWAIGFTMLLSNHSGYVIEDFYAHNFWLDYGRDGGIYASVLMFLFSMSILFKSLKLHKNSFSNPCLSYCLIVWSIVAFAALFTEPVHVGAPVFMHMYFLISGIIVTLSKRKYAD